MINGSKVKVHENIYQLPTPETGKKKAKCEVVIQPGDAFWI